MENIWSGWKNRKLLTEGLCVLQFVVSGFGGAGRVDRAIGKSLAFKVVGKAGRHGGNGQNSQNEGDCGRHFHETVFRRQSIYTIYVTKMTT